MGYDYIYSMSLNSNTNKGVNMTKLNKKQNVLSDIEQKQIVSYVKLRTIIKKYSKQVELIKPKLEDIFKKKKSNFVVAYDIKGNEFGIQRINKSRDCFQTKAFKEQHIDLYDKFSNTLNYVEYKAIEGNNE